jgi:hypothetical protein
MSETLHGPHEGELLPDFTLSFRDGRILHRRALKGRSHAVIYFPPDRPPHEEEVILAALAARVPDWQAARAAVLIVLPADGADASETLPVEPVIDRDGTMRARFGVGPGGALFVADRYGEIALRADGAMCVLPLDEVTPTLALLEVRCSL